VGEVRLRFEPRDEQEEVEHYYGLESWEVVVVDVPADELAECEGEEGVVTYESHAEEVVVGTLL